MFYALGAALAFTKSSLSQWHCLVTGGHFKLAKISFYFLYYRLKIMYFYLILSHTIIFIVITLNIFLVICRSLDSSCLGASQRIVKSTGSCC